MTKRESLMAMVECLKVLHEDLTLLNGSVKAVQSELSQVLTILKTWHKPVGITVVPGAPIERLIPRTQVAPVE